MASVLGRITTSGDSPRGPDVKHRIRVKNRWLERGETIEFSLPRNLTCAKCDGGGCDACGGAGALSLRDRGVPPEIVRVGLPVTPESDDAGMHAVAIRIPERGGISDPAQLPRGMLILTVVGDRVADDGVRKVHPSLVPSPPELAEERKSVTPIDAETHANGITWPAVIAAAIVGWVLLLVALRAAGAF